MYPKSEDGKAFAKRLGLVPWSMVVKAEAEAPNFHSWSRSPTSKNIHSSQIKNGKKNLSGKGSRLPKKEVSLKIRALLVGITVLS